MTMRWTDKEERVQPIVPESTEHCGPAFVRDPLKFVSKHSLAPRHQGTKKNARRRCGRPAPFVRYGKMSVDSGAACRSFPDSFPPPNPMSIISPLRLAFAALFVFLPALSAQDITALPAAVRAQADALAAEKSARTPAQHKLAGKLIFAVKKDRGERIGAGLDQLEAGIRVDADHAADVDIDAEVTPALLAEIARVGGKVKVSVPRFHSIRARVPLAAVEALAARADVRFIKPAVKAFTNAGPTTSEGDATHRADSVRSMLKATGRGIRIGVISDSVDFLGASQATGELGPVTVLPGQDAPGNSGEGTAMLEIIHDIAPDAELFFATAFLSEAGFAQNILDLRAAGCDIIIDDVGYFDESPFQDGPVAQAVNQVADDGALYFSAAGNSGNKNDDTSGTWEGDFVDGGPTSGLIAKGGRLHNWGSETFNTLVTGGFALALFWSDPAGASRNDYDLYLLNSTGTAIVDASTTTQNGTQDPLELLGTSATNSGNRVVVVKAPDAAPRFLHVDTFRGDLAVNTEGVIAGHSGAEKGISVAAVDAATSFPDPFVGGLENPVEDFSSDGPRRVFYEADGTPITPGNFSSTGGKVLQKPDLAAADGVATSVPGFSAFFGTSAAAPHAGAIAALVWSRNRTLTPAEVLAALKSTALDIEDDGPDRDSGVGLLDALAAAQAVPGKPILRIVGTSLVSESFLPANNAIDPGETVTVSLNLINDGPVATSGLVVSLAALNGVTNPSGSQDYGILASNSSASRTFTFRANPTSGTSLTARFDLTDGGAGAGSLATIFSLGTLGPAMSFTSSGTIAIPLVGNATPYPSTLNIAGVPNTIGKVTARLNNISHTYLRDIVTLLVSPGGQAVMLMAGVGDDQNVSNLTLTLDDNAATALPITPTAVSGTFRPTAYLGEDNVDFTTPAPAAPYSTTLSTFIGGAPNGTWRLFVKDRENPDGGTIANFTVSVQPLVVASSGPGMDAAVILSVDKPSVRTLEAVTFTARVFNYGATAATGATLTLPLLAGFQVGSMTTSQGSVNLVGTNLEATLGTIPAGGNATVTLTGAFSGALTNNQTATVTLAGSDLDPSNNTAATPISAGMPNLLPSQPSGWDNRLVVSTVAGTNTSAVTIDANQPIFLDAAYENGGNASANAYFLVDLYVDGVRTRRFDHQTVFNSGTTRKLEDIPIGTLPPGRHTVELRIDPDDEVPELNQADNIATRTFLVEGPNLRPFAPVGASGFIVVSRQAGTTTDSPVINTNDIVRLDVLVINTGNVATSADSVGAISLDAEPLAQLPIGAGFGPGEITGQVDLSIGTLSAGTHTIRVFLDPNKTVAETDETYNVFEKTFVVNGLPTISDIANVTIDENTSTGATAFTIGDGETAAANLTLSASSSDPAKVPTDNIVFGGSDTNRTVNVTPASGQSGTVTITVTVNDGTGGTLSDSFDVTIVAVNDPPTFSLAPSATVAQGAGPQTAFNFAANIAGGPGGENSQPVTFALTPVDPTLFAAQPAISPTGTLTFTPAADASGSTMVSVVATDEGGASSPPQTFEINVTSFAEELGTYVGLILPSGAGSAAQTGTIAMTLGNGGSMSGKLTLGGTKYAFKGFILNDGSIRFGSIPSTSVLPLQRKGQDPLTVTLNVGVAGNAGNAGNLTGEILDGSTPFSTIDADIAGYGKDNPVPASLAGNYTILFRALNSATQGRPSTTYPQGDGAATFKIDTNGNVTLKGTLADGGKVSAKSTLASSNRWPFYATTDKKKGAVASAIQMEDTAGISDGNGTLTWFKPANTKAKLYKDGWADGILADIIASRFTSTSGTAIFPDISPADANGNAKFVTVEGQIAPPLFKALSIDNKSKVSVVAKEEDKLSLKLSTKTGLVSGKFVHPESGKSSKLSGAVFQKQAGATGFFLGPNESGGFSITEEADPAP
jgi:subtilisin-like proprotein convertase family protein